MADLLLLALVHLVLRLGHGPAEVAFPAHSKVDSCGANPSAGDGGSKHAKRRHGGISHEVMTPMKRLSIRKDEIITYALKKITAWQRRLSLATAPSQPASVVQGGEAWQRLAPAIITHCVRMLLRHRSDYSGAASAS